MGKQVLIISGPTGSGENTLANEIISRFPAFKRLITATSRPMRSGEKNLNDYYFFTKEQFLNEIKKSNILEYTYVKNRDTYYGSYKPELEKQIREGCNLIITPDIIGTKFYKKHYNATTIFIDPGSIDDLKIRIKKRNPEMSEKELEKRLENARAEIKNEKPFYDYTVYNRNEKLEDAVNDIISILKRENYKLS